ncbi:MAG: transcription elongation factor GreA [Desulfonatronovibrionaceae bacterium]
MSTSIPISKQGFAKLKQELEELKKQRPEITQAIKEAREEGDLRENAGYDAAKERQGLLEAKITQIESRMPNFQVIDLDKMGGSRVAFGATVEIVNVETEENKRYTLLGPDESNVEKGTISIQAPLARALLGKEEGDEVEVNAPIGKVEYEIVSVEYNGSKIYEG